MNLTNSDRTAEGQIIGGLFSNHLDAEEAVKALQEWEIFSDKIEQFAPLDDTSASKAYLGVLSDRGFSKSHAIHYDEWAREGKILVVVYDVADPAPILSVFKEHHAEYPSNGSCNLREEITDVTSDEVKKPVERGTFESTVAGAAKVAGGPLAKAIAQGGPAAGQKC